HARQHREAQPMRLPRPVVRILAEDDDLDRVERSGVEGGEDLRTRRINGRAGGLALAQERAQLPHVLALEPVADARLPGLLQLQRGLAHHLPPSSDRCFTSSFRRKPESSPSIPGLENWIPAFAVMTGSKHG